MGSRQIAMPASRDPLGCRNHAGEGTPSARSWHQQGCPARWGHGREGVHGRGHRRQEAPHTGIDKCVVGDHIGRQVQTGHFLQAGPLRDTRQARQGAGHTKPVLSRENT